MEEGRERRFAPDLTFDVPQTMPAVPASRPARDARQGGRLTSELRRDGSEKRVSRRAPDRSVKACDVS